MYFFFFFPHNSNMMQRIRCNHRLHLITLLWSIKYFSPFESSELCGTVMMYSNVSVWSEAECPGYLHRTTVWGFSQYGAFLRRWECSSHSLVWVHVHVLVRWENIFSLKTRNYRKWQTGKNRKKTSVMSLGRKMCCVRVTDCIFRY